MAIISTALLNQLQYLSEGDMPDVFSVDIGGTFTSDGAGGGTYSGPGQRGPYSCRFGQGDGTEREIAARMDDEVVGVITYPLDVTLADQETATGTHTRTNTTFRFRVQAILPQSSFAVHRKARIERIG